MHRLLIALVCASVGTLAACTETGLPPVIDARDVAAKTGAPAMRRVTDAGTAIVPRQGSIEAVSDGVASPGELLVIEGSGFGRLPTVHVGGRAAEVLARVRGDGIVVRVPAGVPAGPIKIEVATTEGRAELPFVMRRLGVVLAEDKLRFVAVGADAVAAVQGELALPRARQVRVDSTGGAAIVLSDADSGSHVVVVDLGRAKPDILGSVAIVHRGQAIAAAANAPRIVVIGDGKLTVIDTTSLRRPVLYEPAPLPKQVHGVRRAELSPDGHELAILVDEGNRVVLLDVQNPAAPRFLSSVDVLPGERASLVHELAFSPNGQTLWVISGANSETFPQVIPTRVTALRLVSDAFANEPNEAAAGAQTTLHDLAVWKTQVVSGAGAPLSMVVGRPPDAGGSAIRTAPESATVYIAAAKSALFELRAGPIDDARLHHLFGAGGAGMVARGELGSAGGPVATTAEMLGAITIPAGGERALALALRVDPIVEIGVMSVPLDGRPGAVFTPLAPFAPRDVHPPFAIGDLAVQP
jgi:hypothetical protein